MDKQARYINAFDGIKLCDACLLSFVYMRAIIVYTVKRLDNGESYSTYLCGSHAETVKGLKELMLHG